MEKAKLIYGYSYNLECLTLNPQNRLGMYFRLRKNLRRRI